ncbi:GntR family transcriptional regulator [Chengkuizengella axinellae]|uniref:GntR family transcriptional regulator n=1 Tax=Chengkuizengella axinellae TaxID=3064388 RepID=A0ABT9IZT5_9BACL|nr:GntR family transcriptional regulator [Chengkuizengella sp. 2205SS18-9]MDP5274833.1 GntR family transcriptional regulator [Chengkuizengella sp. 2205SS18-9]
MKPKYITIKEKIENMIEAGEYQPGDQFGSEYEMAMKFEVSRETFRSAVRLLEQEGKVHVKHGVGTFIMNPLPEVPNNLEKLTSITAMMKLAGLKDTERHESIKNTHCPEKYAAPLNLTPDDFVYIHERTRIVHNEPVVISINILPEQYFGGIFEERGLSEPLFKVLEAASGIRIVRSNTEIIVPPPTDPYCDKLLIKPETTVLLLEQQHFDESNRPIMYSIDYYRNDIFKFWVQRM